MKHFMRLQLFPLILILSLATVAQSKANPQNTDKDAEGHYWWQHAVFYEIYPRSYGDTNGDGTGDLNGITARLDHLKSLGVDAIWITPCFPSPQVDFGYDVSDYTDIAPEYGTMKDFERLQAEANKRGIRIILDYVPNHTSDKHKWFQESASSKNNPKRNWYIWRDGSGMGRPPSNWISQFGRSAWKFSPKTNQYYYHMFYPQQPDLNWRNPEVVNAMHDVLRFWMDKGVAGFRLDAVDSMFEDPKLADNPVLEGTNAYGDPNQDRSNQKLLPEMHDALKGMRKVADPYGAVLIGETWTSNIDALNAFYGKNNDELQLPMNFLITSINKLDAARFRKEIAAANAANGWPTYVMSNHDTVRSVDRYTPEGANKDQIAKLLATLMMTLRGTPIMYYGEEIAMVNNDPKSVEDVLDPVGRTGWPKDKGRDGERTPMQWNAAANAGFGTGKPWLPVHQNYKTHNVAAQAKDPNSVLSYYKKIIALRRTNPALHEGNYAAVNESDPNVLAFVREYKGKKVLVALNMTGTPQTVKFDVGTSATTLASSGKATPNSVRLNAVKLGPYQSYVGAVKP